jgi:hypothetical protein
MEAEEMERRARAAEKLRQLDEAARERELEKLREQSLQQAQKAIALVEQDPTPPASPPAPLHQPAQLQPPPPPPPRQVSATATRPVEVVPAPKPQKPAWAQPLFRDASAAVSEEPGEVVAPEAAAAQNDVGGIVADKGEPLSTGSHEAESIARSNEQAGEWGRSATSDSRRSVRGGGGRSGGSGRGRGRGDMSGVRGVPPRGGRSGSLPTRRILQSQDQGNSNTEGDKQKESAEALAAAAVASAARRFQVSMPRARAPSPTPLPPTLPAPVPSSEDSPNPPTSKQDPAVSLSPVPAANVMSSPPAIAQTKGSAANLFSYHSGLDVQLSVHDTPHAPNVDSFEEDEPATGTGIFMLCLHALPCILRYASHFHALTDLPD